MEADMALLDGKVAIITGAGRGLGAAYAKLLAEEGAYVVVNDLGKNDEGQFTAEVVAAEISEAGGKAVAHTQDISTVEGGQSILDCALNTFGRADILINNAGILRDKSFAKLPEEDWDAVIQVNLKSMYAVTQPVFGWMKENGGGVIVNTTSTSGIVGNFGQSNYAAAKSGAWGLSHVLAIEGAKFNIRVWALAPAAVSALTAPLMDEEAKKQFAPEHVAQVVLYMVSELSGKRTGHCLFASGQSVRELKLVSAEGIEGGARDREFSAKNIAEHEDKLYRAENALTINDFAN
jgi:NAD(P)-dependent dehydrogenase (short-subunit alcohol dehydrogenase family)